MNDNNNNKNEQTNNYKQNRANQYPASTMANTTGIP